MKRILSFTTAALLGASMLAAPAAATGLDAGGSAGNRLIIDNQADAANELDRGAGSATPDLDTGTTAAIGATFDSALTAIYGSDMTAQSLSGVAEVRSVEVVKLSELEGHQDTAVQSALQQNSSGVDALQAAIDANSAISTELRARGVSASSIVGAQLGGGGAVTVYVR